MAANSHLPCNQVFVTNNRVSRFTKTGVPRAHSQNARPDSRRLGQSHTYPDPCEKNSDDWIRVLGNTRSQVAQAADEDPRWPAARNRTPPGLRWYPSVGQQGRGFSYGLGSLTGSKFEGRGAGEGAVGSLPSSAPAAVRRPVGFGIGGRLRRAFGVREPSAAGAHCRSGSRRRDWRGHRSSSRSGAGRLPRISRCATIAR